MCVCVCVYMTKRQSKRGGEREGTAKWVRKLISGFPVETARPLSSISQISSVVRIRGHITYFSSTLILVLLGHPLTQTSQKNRYNGGCIYVVFVRHVVSLASCSLPLFILIWAFIFLISPAVWYFCFNLNVHILPFHSEISVLQNIKLQYIFAVYLSLIHIITLHATATYFV